MERTVCNALFIVMGVFVGDEMRGVGGKGWLLLWERRGVGEKECFCRREGVFLQERRNKKDVCLFNISSR